MGQKDLLLAHMFGDAPHVPYLLCIYRRRCMFFKLLLTSSTFYLVVFLIHLFL